MGIRFNLKRTKGQHSTIRAIVRIDGVKYTLATGVKVAVMDWDRKREVCYANQEANTSLAKIRRNIQREIEETGRPPNFVAGKKDLDRPKIIEAIENHRKKKEQESTSPHTWRAYTTLIGNLNRYQKDCGRSERYVADITPEYISGFIGWSQKQNYANSHTAKMVRTLRAVIRKMLPAEIWNETKPPTTNYADQIYLTPEELERMENLILEPGSKLHAARDLFLIGCYTGMRFSDWYQANQSRIQVVGNVEILVITQQKTKGQATPPVSARLRRVIDRYPRGLPKITNQTLNKNIKEAGKMIGLTQVVEITEYRGGKSINVRYQKWELMSSHTARRTFATNALLAEIPMLQVMKFTGHKSVAAFQTYIRSTGAEAAIKYSTHPFFQMNEPLDDFSYKDGQHIDQSYIDRLRSGKMTNNETVWFFHHIEECEECAEIYRESLKDIRK